MDASTERREFTRYIPVENAFVALARVRRMGSIKDISLGGLACDVTVNFGEIEAIKNETVAPLPVDIFVSGKKFLLSRIWCCMAYNMFAPEDPPPYSVSVYKRRCGLKFDELPKAQRQQINHFLENHTVGNA